MLIVTACQLLSHYALIMVYSLIHVNFELTAIKVLQDIYFFYSETNPLQRGQTSAGYQCLRLIIINKQLYYIMTINIRTLAK